MDKRIVGSFPQCKIILAGGLGPSNVYKAIKEVHPYGVDSFTKTSHKDENGVMVKDEEAIVQFVKEARRAFAEIGKE